MMTTNPRLVHVVMGSVLTTLLAVAPGRAQVPNACAVEKKQCVRRVVKRVLACHQKAERTGVPVDPACLAAALTAFDDPTADCFTLAEASGSCRTTGDLGRHRLVVTKFVDDVVRALVPAYPAPTENQCAATKTRCVAKLVTSSLKCHEAADRDGGVVDPTCLARAAERFGVSGGGCMARAETHPPCLTTGDVSPLTGTTDLFTDTVAAMQRGCPAAALPPGDHVRILEHGGLTRTFHLHVPPGYDGMLSTAVVLALHGGFQPATLLLSQTALPAKSDAAGFLLAAPEGTALFGIPTWNAGNCCGGASLTDVDDVGFVAAMVNALADEVCVDWARIFATGLSNGAMFSYRLACQLSDRIAAIAPDAGGMGDVNLNVSPPVTTYACLPVRPVPVLHMHGMADTCYPFAGGVGTGFSGTVFASIPDTIAGWVARNGCAGTTTQTYASGAATCDTYDACAQGADVTLCTVMGLGHVWPGQTSYALASTCGGGTTTDLVANDVAWDFFSAHPLP
jgi:polyhydroxybutyrate depolymerase